MITLEQAPNSAFWQEMIGYLNRSKEAMAKIDEVLTEAREEAIKSFTFPGPKEKAIFNNGFRAGFTAGLEYQQKAIDAYRAYLLGELTLSELGKIVNN